jgi:hypothetical protein
MVVGYQDAYFLFHYRSLLLLVDMVITALHPFPGEDFKSNAPFIRLMRSRMPSSPKCPSFALGAAVVSKPDPLSTTENRRVWPLIAPVTFTEEALP